MSNLPAVRLPESDPLLPTNASTACKTTAQRSPVKCSVCSMTMERAIHLYVLHLCGSWHEKHRCCRLHGQTAGLLCWKTYQDPSHLSDEIRVCTDVPQPLMRLCFGTVHQAAERCDSDLVVLCMASDRVRGVGEGAFTSGLAKSVHSQKGSEPFHLSWKPYRRWLGGAVRNNFRGEGVLVGL
eukprot:CAMPEP_0206607938 /NCGR_PEP_ID=MMETSP0325_2-20121206/52579_1 /ASSEMBLY_ACC=CAM_ASM_000347 /TAXON_ID=2866 /ORGANISM="Crypthecodinium cohnii, Strain Seligo" /LENGTH=181 /DNA_ID=CAMNT_0054125309 /DNA_START=50 /DNA_END=595 /DNA_ORIENTATION=+